MARRGLGILAGIRERGAKRRAARKASSSKDSTSDKRIEGSAAVSDTGKERGETDASPGAPTSDPRGTPILDAFQESAATRRARRAARRGDGDSDGGGGDGGGDGGSGGSDDDRPLGDQIPEAPQLTGSDASDTGIAGPSSEDGSTQSVQDLGQGLVDAEIERDANQTAAQIEDQKRGQGVADTTQSDKEETVERLDDAGDKLGADQARFEASQIKTQANIDAIPTEVTNEFNRLRDEFGATTDASFDRIDSQRGDALADASKGRSAAMQAAVQGIQGNVNTQVSSIMSNPNLTQGQKQSMIAQVRLAGASSMAPAIGATVLAFNQLSSDIATKFGSMTAQLESTILTEEAGLTGLQGQAFAQAQVAVGTMTNTLLEINANASASFANAQSQLLATRSHATMTGNDILLRTLPEQSEPFSDPTGAAMLAYDVGYGILKDQLRFDLGEFATKLDVLVLRNMQGSTASNIIDGFAEAGPLGGFAAFLEDRDKVEI